MKANINKSYSGGIVLFAKQPGKTSFSSLFTIKHALETKKVGHTGTLDSFAQGLLVVMVGSHTRLAQIVTSFDKEYEAIIKFGVETDTLDYSGNIVKTKTLPTKKDVEYAVKQHIGDLMQSPPLFSAVHVNGKRASDLARSGKKFEIPKREITVYNAEIIELTYKDNIDISDVQNKLVEYAHVKFHVSKGTYIRCLARDIGIKAGSCAHLIGLLRTSVGSFNLNNAAGASLLAPFNIQTVCKNLIKTETNYYEKELQEEVQKKITYMDTNLAKECGFIPITLTEKSKDDFFNGKPLKFDYFLNPLDIKKNINNKLPNTVRFAVFSECKVFVGVIESVCNKKTNKTNLVYSFVIAH